MRKTWQHVVVQAPLRRAPELMPAEVGDGRTTLEIGLEASAEAAFWGRDTRRYRLRWRSGRSAGRGYVEFRPHSSDAHEAVVHLESPGGPARLVWSQRRLDSTALGLALLLRRTMLEAAAERVPEPRTARRRVAAAARSA